MVLLKKALIWFLARPAAQALLLDALEAVAKRTDNTVDDRVVAALRLGLVGLDNPAVAAIMEWDGYCEAENVVQAAKAAGEQQAAAALLEKECDTACKVGKAFGGAAQVAGAVKAVKDAVK